MGLFTNLFKKDRLKDIILTVQNNIEEMIPDHSSERFNVMWYGAYDANPKKLVYQICVQTDKGKKELQDDTRLNAKLRNLLEKYNYPEAARPFVHIGFESQETVNRESGGSWNLHFK